MSSIISVCNALCSLYKTTPSHEQLVPSIIHHLLKAMRKYYISQHHDIIYYKSNGSLVIVTNSISFNYYSFEAGPICLKLKLCSAHGTHTDAHRQLSHMLILIVTNQANISRFNMNGAY